MEVVEDREEGVLRSRSVEILYIIHDQHIHLLVECYEVCELVLYVHRIHELSLEAACWNIQNYEFRIFLLDCDTDRLRKMGLSKSRPSEKEERVERSLARSSRNTLTSCETHPVALTYYKVLKTIYWIELWIYLDSLHSREHERTRVTALGICLY